MRSLSPNPPIPYNNRMRYTCVFFDLDETLYPSSTGLWSNIRDRMNDYMRVQLGIPADQIPIIRRFYFDTYGTTLRGLQIHYKIDTDDFLAFVHDLPIEEVLKADQELYNMLSSMPQQKWVFTNANVEHANRVLNALQIQDCFNGIIDIRSLGFVCKPDPKSYKIAMQIAGVDTPGECVYLDDALRNLVPAKNLGFYTVLISSDGMQSTADLTLTQPHDLLRSLPELWVDFSTSA